MAEPKALLYFDICCPNYNRCNSFNSFRGRRQALTDFLRNEFFFERVANPNLREFKQHKIDGECDKGESGLYILKVHKLRIKNCMFSD